MAFTSPIFLFAILPITLLGYYLIRSELKNTFLLAVSLGLYYYYQADFFAIILSLIVVTYLMGIVIAKLKTEFVKKSCLLLTILLDVGILFVFKYFTFFVDSINEMFGKNFSVPDIILPIGISFFTFKAISYIVDVYRDSNAVERNLIDLALYISFFPQMMAGPISRYGDVSKELKNNECKVETFSKGVNRFIIGLAKKLILCNSFAVVVDRVFSIQNTEELTILMSWLGAICYTLQIYYDFSGYSDMAIGLGNMFGFYFKENFDYPYISRSVSEFWRRWHISLGSWFRDYVYFSLGGSRVNTKFRLVFNLFVVWFLTGVWHGANWTFIAWGLFYWVLLMFEKLSGYPQKIKSPVLQFVYRLFTIGCIIIGWVIFRADSLTYAIGYIASMFGIQGNGLSDSFSVFLLRDGIVLIVLGVVFSTPILKKIEKKVGQHLAVQIISRIGMILLLLVSISYSIISSYNPFIYFDF